MSIKEHHPVSIENKIFSLKEIRELSAVVWHQYELEKNSTGVKVQFLVKSSDGILFTSEDVSIFNEDSRINKKKIISITMIFEKGEDKSVKIYIEHGIRKVEGNYINESTLEIAGTDRAWISAVTKELEWLINAAQEREPFFFKYKKLFRWVYFLIGIYASFIAFNHLRGKELGSILPVMLSSIGNFIGISVFLLAMPAALFCAAIASIIESKADNLWPPIELQIGPSHLHKEKEQRKFWWTFSTLIIIPILISILLELFHK